VADGDEKKPPRARPGRLAAKPSTICVTAVATASAPVRRESSSAALAAGPKSTSAAAACPSGALADRGQAPWPHAAEIGSSCLSIQAIACRLCEEHCEPRAIRFHPALGGRVLPSIAAETCTACGACAHVCPAHAITFQEAAPLKFAAPEVSACLTA
jgi:ferredoxin-type protein NapF